MAAALSVPPALACDDESWKMRLSPIVKIIGWKRSMVDKTSLFHVALSVGPESAFFDAMPLFPEVFEEVRAAEPKQNEMHASTYVC